MQRTITISPSFIIKMMFLVVLISSFSPAIFAQCDRNSISEGRLYYENGQFDKVIKALEDCTRNGFKNNQQQIEALDLLARTFIAIDSINIAKDYVAKLLLADPTFQSRPSDPVVFRALIFQGQLGDFGNNVSSVSKISESLYETPATVIVVSAEEIMQRGYLSLEALLYDLPGFNISQSNGGVYSLIYPRGYRSADNDKMLLLVDGVEDNNLWSSTVDLSRQYGLSNIHSVEIIYGPNSTIYGANAIVGIINIKTKNSRHIVAENRLFGAEVQAGYGSWNTRYIDANVAARVPNVPIELTVSARVFLSDEPSYSNYDWLGYDTIAYSVDYQDTLNRSIGIFGGAESVNTFYEQLATLNPSDAVVQYFEPVMSGNDTVGVQLSEAGTRRAIALDNNGLRTWNYEDDTESFALNAKLKVFDVTVGWQYWLKREGYGPTFTNQTRGSTQQGQTANPFHSAIYLRYQKQITKVLGVNIFTRYKVHSYDGNNAIVDLYSYQNGRLGLLDLAQESTANARRTYQSTYSGQLRTELSAQMQFNPRWNVIAGVEVRSSNIQSNFLNSDQPSPQITAPDSALGAARYYNSRDFGLYIQTSYRFAKHWRATLGLRADENIINYEQGWGSQLSPKVALVYHNNQHWYFKFMYGRAFKSPTIFNLYSTTIDERELSSPELEPEIVDNVELSSRYLTEWLDVEAVAYFANYRRVLRQESVPFNDGVTGQFKSEGRLRIGGGHIAVNARWRKFNNYLNYSFVSPYSLDIAGTGDWMRETSIAPHRLNIGSNYNIGDFNFNLRLNVVGSKPLRNSKGNNNSSASLPAYALLNGAVSYRIPNSAIFIDVMVNNILNTEYFSPGVGQADDVIYASRLPQPRINGSLRVRARF